MQYVEHPEHKFNGEVGILERKHVHADGVVYIGKEANNIDEQELNVKQAQAFLNKKEIMQNILDLSQKKAEEWGVDRKTFQRIKKRIIENGDIKLNTVAVKKLASFFT